MHLREGGASSITWLHSGYYMIKVMLAVFVGLFRSRARSCRSDDRPAAIRRGERLRDDHRRLLQLAAAGLDQKLQMVTIIGSAALLVIVFELVRQRRLMERYSLLWLFAAVVLLVLAIFSDLLTSLSNAVGIQTPSNALFFVMLGFVILMLLHFSASISKLSDELKVLAQQHAAAEERLRRLERDGGPARTRPASSERARAPRDHRHRGLDARLRGAARSDRRGGRRAITPNHRLLRPGQLAGDGAPRPAAREALAAADVVAPDGMGVVKAARLLGESIDAARLRPRSDADAVRARGGRGPDGSGCRAAATTTP